MAQFPSTTNADGIWTLKKVRRAILGSNWPPLVLLNLLEIQFNHNDWVGILNLEVLDDQSVDISSALTWVVGSPSNTFETIDPGEFTSDSDYTVYDPRLGDTHWSDNQNVGGLTLFLSFGSAITFNQINCELTSISSYGVPTVSVFLNGSEIAVSQNTPSGAEPFIITKD